MHINKYLLSKRYVDIQEYEYGDNKSQGCRQSMIPSIGLLILDKWAPSPLTCIYSSCISLCAFLYYTYILQRTSQCRIVIIGDVA
jgi:hypothetical protein